jgi:hypothetical protein
MHPCHQALADADKVRYATEKAAYGGPDGCTAVLKNKASEASHASSSHKIGEPAAPFATPGWLAQM